MIDVQHSNIINAAADTFPTQRCNEFHLARPDARLVLLCPVPIPIKPLAFIGAKLGLRWLTTILANASSPPPIRMIARLPTESGIAILDRIGVCLKWLVTMLAEFSYSCSLSHKLIIARLWVLCKHGYFDIAVKRIEAAMAQLRLPLA